MLDVKLTDTFNLNNLTGEKYTKGQKNKESLKDQRISNDSKQKQKRNQLNKNE